MGSVATDRRASAPVGSRAVVVVFELPKSPEQVRRPRIVSRLCPVNDREMLGNDENR